MNLPRNQRDETSATLTQTLGLILFCCGLLVVTTNASPPAWWASRGATHAIQVTTNAGVVTTNYITNDYAAVTQGQVKQFTRKAVDELNADLTNFGGAGTNLNTMVSNWQQDYATNGYNATNLKPSDYKAMNVGQLKSIAGSVYGRLSAAGYTELSPTWLHQNTNTDNVAAAIGQLKQLYDFDLSLPGSSSLTATYGGTGMLDLNWTLPSTNNVTSWLIEQQNTNGTWNVLTNVASPTATNYFVSGLTNGDSYNFQVIGEGTNSVSIPINVSGTPTAVPTSGLTLWLKADSGVTTNSSGNVTAWADQTGSYPVTQTSTSAQPSYITNDINGKPGLRFNGSQSLYNSASVGSALNSDMTIITVGMSTDASGETFALYFGANATPGANRAYAYNAGSEFFDGQFVYSIGGVAGGPNAFGVEVASLNSALSQTTFYQNGSQTALSTVTADGATFQNVSAGITVGAASGNVAGWNGDIVEQLVYDRQLSTTEVEQVCYYLATKYGLPVGAPPPAITPDGGTFTSSTTVSISGTLPPFSVRYTLDGSSPTSSSTLYTGSFTVTRSCPVSAAVFLSGVPVSSVATAQFYVGDTYGIGISDAWQTEYLGSVTDLNPNALTPGGSGLTYLQAYLWGYNPTLYSTNGDGLSDLVNHELGYSGTNTDINGYGLTNAQQLALGLDPFVTGINPSPPTPPTPNPSDHTAPVITLINPQGATLLP